MASVYMVWVNVKLIIFDIFCKSVSGIERKPIDFVDKT